MLKHFKKSLRYTMRVFRKKIQHFILMCKHIVFRIRVLIGKLFSKFKDKASYLILFNRVKSLLLNVYRKIGNMRFKRAVSGALVFAILIGITIYIPNTKVSALELKYEGNVIGYAKNTSKANLAKEKVIENTECDNEYVESVFDTKIKTEVVEVSESKLDNVHALSEHIVDTVKELTKGYGIYLDGELNCSFERRSDAEFVVSCLNNQIKTDYATDEYEIINNLKIQEGNYLKETMVNFYDVPLDLIYKDIRVHTYKYSERTVKLKYDVVYIVNKDLSFGESNILSKGKNGKCKYYYKTTYLNGKKTSKDIIETKVLNEPETRTIEISQEEYNILMANKTVKNKNYVFPLNSNDYYVSSLYGYRWGKVHGGIDLAVAEGTEIRSYKKGTVITSEYNSSYGNYIVIEHKNGLRTLYAHCNTLIAGAGSTVEKGQIIALSGNTGNSTGPHLHFEVHINGNRVDPAKYIGIFAEKNEDSDKINNLIETINLSGSKLNFINSIKEAAIEGYQHYNILPSLTLAQAVIESAWGESAIGNNIFGIKAFSDWKGAKKYVWTYEEKNDGSKYKTKAWFKDYDSITESVYDHTKLLLGDRYKKVRQASNYREACYAVKEAGYATSSDYAETLINVIETYGLYAWDNVNYKIKNTDDTLHDDKISTTKTEKKKKATKIKNKQTKKKAKATKKTVKKSVKATTKRIVSTTKKEVSSVTNNNFEVSATKSSSSVNTTLKPYDTIVEDTTSCELYIN